MPKPLLTEERRRRFHQALQAIDGTGLDGATVLGDGYTAQAWLLADGETVARIPKYAWAEMALVYEISILQLLEQSNLPAETPRNARQVRDSAGFVGALHRYVAGTPLVDRIEAIRDTAVAEELGRDLGRFLSALHDIPADQFPVGGAVPYPLTFDRWAEVVSPYLDPPGQAWVEHLLARLEAVAPSSGTPVVFNHGDLWRHHILLDADDRLTGIIDWGLGVVADRAWDLRSFPGRDDIATLLGPGFAAALHEAYGSIADEALMTRARVYGFADLIGDAYHELCYLDDVAFIGELREAIARGDQP